MITRYPAAIKSFYMQPDPEDPEVVLGLDMIAPEGYGEIIGGSQRIHDHDLLLQRIRDNGLPVEAYQWYLDVRKYGTFPHSGFGMGPGAPQFDLGSTSSGKRSLTSHLNRIYP
jgi:asparaginyl-tRNA synthetase